MLEAFADQQLPSSSALANCLSPILWAPECSAQVVAQHDAPMRDLFFVKEMGGGMLLTGSWDKTLRYWDLR